MYDLVNRRRETAGFHIHEREPDFLATEALRGHYNPKVIVDDDQDGKSTLGNAI